MEEERVEGKWTSKTSILANVSFINRHFVRCMLTCLRAY